MAFDYKKEYQRYKNHYYKSLQSLYRQPSTKASLNLILSLATISFFALFALKPTMVTIAILWQEIKTKKEVAQKLEQKIHLLNQAEISFAKAKESIPLIDKTLPQSADFLRFEQELEFLSFKNDLVLADARFGQFDLFGGTNSKEAKILNFKLALAGSFKNLKKFLSDLEDLDRVVVLDKISFTTQTEVEGAELQLGLSGKVYYFPYYTPEVEAVKENEKSKTENEIGI